MRITFGRNVSFESFTMEASLSTAQNPIVRLFSRPQGKYQSNVEGMFFTMFSCPPLSFYTGTVFNRHPGHFASPYYPITRRDCMARKVF